MCGIAGIISNNPGAVVDASEIERMCAAIVHRGPDDQGIYVRGDVGLGMRRLSIIDLVSGQQPMHNEDGSIWIVFNGEIYNFLELKTELEQAGHVFYTRSDTEVIVHLYEHFGLDFATRLRGMFAIALYDHNQKRLVLARDRLGKKPLLYAETGDRLLFASEIRSMMAVAPELAQVADDKLLYFFQFGYIPDPHSAFQRIKRLPPGHLLVFEKGQARVCSYWQVPPFVGDSSKTEQEWLEELERELSDAVRMRLISDVPLGALLSGGVDSSTVVALMARASSKPVKTFSIAFTKEDFNEAPYARMVASKFGTEHHELTLEPDIVPTLDRLTRLLEEPFGDSSMLPTYLVSCLVRQHVKVALSGDGGDELFAGYDRYAINLRRERFRFLPQWACSLYRQTVYPALPQGVRGRRFAYNISLPFRERYLDSISFITPDRRSDGLLSADYLRSAAGSAQTLYEQVFDAAAADTPLAKLQCLDMKTYLPADILTKVDRMSMAASLEMRAPILDHVFVEMATRVPTGLKLRDGESKYILKKLAERVGVPREVIYRRKQGFAVPLVHWLRHELKNEVSAILTEPRTLQRGYFNVGSVKKLVAEHLRGTRDRSAEIWLLLVFELWHRNFLESYIPHARALGGGRLEVAAPVPR